MAPQDLEIVPGELEHEIRRKTPAVSLHGADESLGLDAVEARQVRVQEHTLTANDENRSFDSFGRHEGDRRDVCLYGSSGARVAWSGGPSSSMGSSARLDVSDQPAARRRRRTRLSAASSLSCSVDFSRISAASCIGSM